MRIRNNKKHLVVNKEYSRLPYWTDDGYEDVQKSVSQKFVQDNYGAFAESENQLPYLSDADYQGLEYQYQNPEFFDPTDLPDVDFTDTVPKGTCYELWTSIFGHGTGVFIPSSSQWAAIKEYEKLCPVIYVPHICCIGMKISGKTTLTPGEEAYYSVSGGAAGCAYEMKASGGTFVGTKYFAPMTPGTYELYVTPEMSNDRGDKCATLSVTVTGGCDGKIGYTTNQMSVSGTQTLTVTGSTGGTYNWSTTSGSLSASEGTSVVFTAPASNANCTSNPTISLTCGGAVVDTLQIAVNADGNRYAGYICNITHTPGCEIFPSKGGYGYRVPVYGTTGYTGNRYAVFCDGTESMQSIVDPPGTSSRTYSYSTIPGSCGLSHQNAKNSLRVAMTCETLESYVDTRSAARKAAGCCPAQLL